MSNKTAVPKCGRFFGQRDALYVPLYFALCLNLEQFDEVMDHIGIDMRDRGHFIPATAGHAIVQFYNKPSSAGVIHDTKLTAVVSCYPYPMTDSPSDTAGLLVHEAVHVWQECEKIYGDLGCEAEAYYIQHISRELLRMYPDRLAEHHALHPDSK